MSSSKNITVESVEKLRIRSINFPNIDDIPKRPAKLPKLNPEQGTANWHVSKIGMIVTNLIVGTGFVYVQLNLILMLVRPLKYL